MSNPKKKTPLQEAIEYIEETYPTTLKRSGEVRDIMENLKSLLPKEKEFARIMWNGGVDFSLEQTDSSVRKYKEPDFPTFFKQYEP